MPPITLLPAAAKLLPVGLPVLESIIPLEPFLSITEFLFWMSFFAGPAPAAP